MMKIWKEQTLQHFDKRAVSLKKFIVFFLWLITGSECRVLTVQTGGSLIIPCHYDRKYNEHKKYWCFHAKGAHNYCSILAYANETKGKVSVIDHPDQSFFTVSMRNLQHEDTGAYWCAVEIEGISWDVTEQLHLTVQSAPDVFVVSSSVSGHEGGNISVQCFYSSGYQNKVKQWCRYKDQSCYTVGRTNTSQNSSVQISDDGGRSFTVLMTGLRLTDSGWYFCSAGEALNPVQLTVTETEKGTVSDKVNETVILKKHNETKDTAEPQNNQLLTVWLPALATLLLLLTLAGVVTWRWRRKPKKGKHQIKGRNGSRSTDMIYSQPEDPVIYSILNDEIPHDPNEDITYSTIDNVPGSEVMKSPAGGAICSVIYSTVAPH